MNDSRTARRDFEAIAWGMLLIWWGIRWLFDFLPEGTGLLGTGLILLGVNAARSLSGIPGRGVTAVLGILALVLGGLVLAKSVLTLPCEVPVLEILLIGSGLFVLARALRKPTADATGST